MEEWEMGGSKNEWINFLIVLAIAFLVVFSVRLFLFSPIVVDGPSMKPNLHDRDQMIVNKITYHINEPERFDIVVFHATDKKDFIKRVIGLPGEHVMVRENQLYIDGEPVEEPFLNNEDTPAIVENDFQLESLPGAYEEIPKGHVLVLGDNRWNSTDSRALGVISIDKIVGKASLIYWPISRFQFIHE